MFNSIVIKINILYSLTEIRHTDVKDFLRKSCLSTPSHLTVTAPSGHAAPLVFNHLSLILFSRSQYQKGDRENDIDTNMLIIRKLDCV